MLPAVAEQKPLSFSNRPIETDEATDILRFLLSDFPDASKLTSHSCKETPLSWLAKAGADKSTLDFMGRHVGTISSSDVYARGMQARPLRKFSHVIKQIYLGVFDPDATRSGMFRTQPFDDLGARGDIAESDQGPLATTDVETPEMASAHEELGDSPTANSPTAAPAEAPAAPASAAPSSECTSSSSSSSSDDSAETDQCQPPQQQPEGVFFIHPKGKVHVKAIAGATRFKCGRKASDTFVATCAGSFSPASLCGQCEPATFPIKSRSDLIRALDTSLSQLRDNATL